MHALFTPAHMRFPVARLVCTVLALARIFRLFYVCTQARVCVCAEFLIHALACTGVAFGGTSAVFRQLFRRFFPVTAIQTLREL